MQLALTRKKEKVETMSVKKKDRITDIFVFIFLTMGAIVMIAPLLWMVSTSLKSKDEVFSLPPVWIPTDISFNKYMEIWNMGPLLSGISNSLIVALSVTIVGTFTSSLAAFAFAKLNFRGKNKIFLLLFASVMIPYPVLMIPQFMMFSEIGWVDTLLPLIVPGLFGNIFMIFFLRQFLNSIPNSIIEAAKLTVVPIFKSFIKSSFH